MTITINPEHGIPFPDEDSPKDLAAQVKAAANTACELEKHGLSLEPSKEDKDVAAKLAVAYADDPEKTSKKATTKRVAKLTPASLVLTNNILTEFGQSVVESATQIRHLVTNKLLLESENEDAKVRMRALELLGKISDVGLFAEKSEVTITHQSSDDLRARLRGKLEKIANPIDSIEDVVITTTDPINIEEELGAEDDIIYDDD